MIHVMLFYTQIGRSVLKTRWAMRNRLPVAELRLALFKKSSHAFGLVFGREKRLKQPPFIVQPFGKGGFERAVDGILGREGGNL